MHGIRATVLAHDDANRVRCRPPRSRQTPVVGDEVEFHVNRHGAFIESIEARTRTFTRPHDRKPLHIATDVDRVLLVQAVQPGPRPALIDRVALALHDEDIPLTLILNKCDLDGVDVALEQLEEHRALGYPIITVSARAETNLEALRPLIASGKTVIVGHSGVGKSTLLNALVPGAELATGDVNEQTNKGRHTTTVSTCHVIDAWPGGGLLIDTPGVRSFSLHGLAERELARRFVGLHEFAERCRFNDCLHDSEPDCAVRFAVNAGELRQSRLSAYHDLLESLRAGEG